jgi:peroxiredoxin/glyoxylase-like metal-dependent hydrolase (beta-lactamase superfamily II)
MTLVEVSEHVVQLRVEPVGSGSDYFSTMVVTDEGAVVIDPTSDAVAARWAEEIRARGLSLEGIVYSHWHLDHATGADTLRQAFGAEVPIIGHERTVARQERWNAEHPDQTITVPNDTVSDEGRVLSVGGVDIELAYMGHAHSDNMLVVTVSPDRVMYACDFVQNRGVAYSDLPGVDVEEQLAMLYRVGQVDVDHVIFCHTPPGDPSTVRDYTTYFEQLWDAVAAAIERGLDEDRTVAEVTMDDYRDWLRADRWLASNVRGMHRWLEANPDIERPRPPPRARAHGGTDAARLGSAPDGLGVRVGEPAPTGSAQDADGNEVTLESLRATGPILLIFYRGGWCPYCNYQVRMITEANDRFGARGVTPVFVSVDRVEEANRTRATYEIPFPVLSDPDLALHRAFGVVHHADGAEVARLRELGHDIEAYAGRDHHAFAVPSVFVIDADGRARWQHVDPDYRVRPTVEQLLVVLDELGIVARE